MNGTRQPISLDLLAVKKQILTCQKCELSQKCKSPIPLTMPSSLTTPTVNVDGLNKSAEDLSFGPERPTTPAQFTVLGEAPGRIEDHQGRAFVGPAGELLRGRLRRVGLDDEAGVYMNAVSCWPHGTPSNQHLAACRQNLKDQLSISPKFVLVCGRVALNSLIPHATLQYATGFLIPIHNKLVFPIIHPSFFLWKNREVELMEIWEGMIGKFSLMLQWGEDSEGSDRCIYCGGYGFPSCRKHFNTWSVDSRWDVVKRRSKKKGLQDERLFNP